MGAIKDKVGALVKGIEPQLVKTNEVIRKYTTNTVLYNMDLFESVKRELIDILVDVSDVHGQLNSYHIMYTEGRKTKKAEVMQQMIDRNMTVTAADKMVYEDKGYKEYVRTMMLIEQAFRLVNSKYYLINTTLSAVQQSIANSRNIENK